MTIEEKRRDLFEAWLPNHYWLGEMEIARDSDEYAHTEVQVAWEVFNAALDAVVIELPNEYTPSVDSIEAMFNEALIECRAAIESTGLGLKVLP